MLQEFFDVSSIEKARRSLGSSSLTEFEMQDYDCERAVSECSEFSEAISIEQKPSMLVLYRRRIQEQLSEWRSNLESSKRGASKKIL